jgi:hypothetical protein
LEYFHFVSHGFLQFIPKFCGFGQFRQVRRRAKQSAAADGTTAGDFSGAMDK